MTPRKPRHPDVVRQSPRAKAAGVKPSRRNPTPKADNAAKVEAVLQRIERGELVTAACQAEEMRVSYLYEWRDASPANAERYTRAREEQAHAIAEQCFEIADDTTRDTRIGQGGPEPNKEWMMRSKLRVETRRWYVEKVAPRFYGQKVDVTTNGEPLTAARVTQMTTEEIKAEIARRLGAT